MSSAIQDCRAPAKRIWPSRWDCRQGKRVRFSTAAALVTRLEEAQKQYRAVLVLCDLEGRTRKEVARQFGVPEGTVAGRLVRARAMLANRLTERGVTLSVGALAAVLSQDIVGMRNFHLAG